MKDYSGKGLSRKTHKVLFVINVTLLLCAVGIATYSLMYDEFVMFVGMALVSLVTIHNIYMAWKYLRNKGKMFK